MQLVNDVLFMKLHNSHFFRLVVLIHVLVIFLGACTPAVPDVEKKPDSTFDAPVVTQATLLSQTAVASPTAAAPISPVSPTPIPTPTSTELPPNVAVLPDPQTYRWELVVEGLSQLSAVVSPQDGTGRLFALEQSGRILLIQDGELQEVPFLDLRDRVRTSGGTTFGLLGMAFPPDFAQTGNFYVHYTAASSASQISMLTTSPNPNIADPSSEVPILEISFPIGEHRGGDLAFGPDNYLYLSIGDGGAAGFGDEPGNAQNPDTLPGSILRIDIYCPQIYCIPVDNPFAAGGGQREVWAYGLRNPWRFTFDALTGDLYIADVGENQREEINFLPAGSPAGANFGWNYLEGSQPYRGQPPDELSLTPPVFEYDHTLGCSVAGGVVYRGEQFPGLFGVYLFGDYCQGKVWGLLRQTDGSWEQAELFDLPAYITSFAQDEFGGLYLSDYAGKIYRLVGE